MISAISGDALISRPASKSSSPPKVDTTVDLFKKFEPASERSLALALMREINPKKIPDGHCMACAFSTCMAFMGLGIKEAPDPEGEYFKSFGDRFYETFKDEYEGVANSIESTEDETYGSYKSKIEDSIKEKTKKNEPVMISISGGAHWIAGFNDGEKIWFIDSQTGKGFNLYESEKEESEKISDSQSVEIVKVPKEYFLKEKDAAWWKDG